MTKLCELCKRPTTAINTTTVNRTLLVCNNCIKDIKDIKEVTK